MLLSYSWLSPGLDSAQNGAVFSKFLSLSQITQAEEEQRSGCLHNSSFPTLLQPRSIFITPPHSFFPVKYEGQVMLGK